MTLKELDPSPYFSIINVHLVGINVFAKFYEIPSLPCLFKILKTKMTWKDNMKTVYPHPTENGYNNEMKRNQTLATRHPLSVEWMAN